MLRPLSLLPLFALACGEPEKSAPVAVDILGDPGHLDLPDLDIRGIVFIEVDTLRVDHLARYGYHRDTMPLTDSWPWLQVNGHVAPASWTFPSVTSLLTGLEPVRHGLVSVTGPGIPVDTLHSPTWPRALSEAGWETAVFTGNNYLSPDTGLSGEFGTAVLQDKTQTGQNNLLTLMPLALEWLDRLPLNTKFLIHLQPMDVHDPYGASESDLAMFRSEALPFWAPLSGVTVDMVGDYWEAAASEAEREDIEAAARDLYDAGILGLDRSIDATLHALQTRGLLESTLVVLSADHGEYLGDGGTGLFGHRVKWRQVEAQIPLMFLLPTGETGKLDCMSMNLDVWPTLYGAMGMEIPAELMGIDGIDLRQGCRTSVRGSHWDPDGPDSIGVAHRYAALTQTCSGGRPTGTPLSDKVDPVENIPATALKGGEVLTSLLDEAIADVLAVHPDAKCAP